VKRKFLISILLVLLLVISRPLIACAANKTFFKDYYEVRNAEGKNVKIPLSAFSYYLGESQEETGIHAGAFRATFYTLKRTADVQKTIDDYFDKLQSCYDESYFADMESDITLICYGVSSGKPFQKIYLIYEPLNRAADEFVLEENWLGSIRNEEILEAEITKYTPKGDVIETINKKGETNAILEIFDAVSQDGLRIENNKNLSSDVKKEYCKIEAYYQTDVLSIFVFDDKYLVFTVTDMNDHPKNAVYDIANAEQLLIDIFEKY